MLGRTINSILIAALVSGCSTTGRPTSNVKSPVDPSTVIFTNIDDWDSPPKLLSGNNPIYPVSLLVAGIRGHCEVAFTIGTDGRATDFYIVSATDIGFINHTLLALKEWKFQPAMRDGVAIEARVKRKFIFGRY